MPQLPFVVAPKRLTRIVSAEVNGETCSIEFPIFGNILAGEGIDTREHEYQTAVFRESAALTDALIAIDGIDEISAQRMAIRILSSRMGIPVPLEPAEHRTMIAHGALVAKLQNNLTAEHKALMLRSITAAIKHRLPGCSAWSEADSIALPQPLQDAIAAFVDSEKNARQPTKSAEELVEDMVQTLGKLGPGSGQSPPTGETSTGGVASSGPMLPSSAVSASHASRSTTSSKRSKKANAG